MKRYIIAASLCCYSFLAQAENLSDIYSMALDNDPTYKSAAATYRANRELFPQAIAQMLPTVTGSASSSGNHSQVVSLGGYNLQSRQLTLKQPVFHIDHWIQLFKARAQVKQVYATYTAALQDLMVRTSQQYFNILAAADDLKFSRSQRQTFSRHLEQTQQRFDVGLIAITDVHDAQARHDNAVAKEIAAENGLADQFERLREITGSPIRTIAPLNLAKGALTLEHPEPADIEKWVETAISQNLELKSATYSKEAAKKELARQRAGHFPTADIDASLKRANSTPPLNYTADSQSYGITITLPILQGGQILSKSRESRALYDKAQYDWDKTLKSISSQARRSYRGVITEISSVTSLTQAVKSNQSALDATTAAYQVGTRTIVDVMDSQTNLLSAERDNAKAHYSYIVELLKLKKAAGTLSDEDVARVNTWLITLPAAS